MLKARLVEMQILKAQLAEMQMLKVQLEEMRMQMLKAQLAKPEAGMEEEVVAMSMGVGVRMGTKALIKVETAISTLFHSQIASEKKTAPTQRRR